MEALPGQVLGDLVDADAQVEQAQAAGEVDLCLVDVDGAPDGGTQPVLDLGGGLGLHIVVVHQVRAGRRGGEQVFGYLVEYAGPVGVLGGDPVFLAAADGAARGHGPGVATAVLG